MNKTFENTRAGLWHTATARRFITLAMLALGLLPLTLCLCASAQGTAFTYQGRLNDGANPANGLFDLQFGVYDAVTNGNQQGNLITNSATAVSNGLFTVTLDFGSQFPGADRWLEIGARTNGAVSFTILAPRQQVTPTPYAMTAQSVNGAILASQLSSIGNTNGGGGNFFAGPSGNATTSGYANTANGFYAFNNNTSGSGNTANGYAALNANSIGINNTANGNAALLSNTSGYNNTANGDSALYSNTTGSENTADGLDALAFNTFGGENTANGFQALENNTNGSANTADGYQALYDNTSGSNNIAMGNLAGYNITTGSSNVDIGNQGLATDTNIIRIGSGQTQTFIAGVINGDGGGLTDLNASAAQLTSIGNANGGFYNFFVGPSGNATTSGKQNTATGYNALINDTDGTENTAYGQSALYFNTDGSYNTAIGDGALFNNSGGYNNTADGNSALSFNTSGYQNTANGVAALLFNTSGNDNTSDGYYSLFSNASGSFNTADSDSSLYSNTNGSDNTADGYGALYSNTSGSNNTALGYLAGYNITTGSSNIDIGNLGLATDTKIIRIGSGQTQTFIAGVIYGDGGGLTDLNVSAAQLTSIGNTNGGGDNFFAGPSGNAATSGSENTANGGSALMHNSSGSYNTANGYDALISNTSGWYNTANGQEALYFNTIGSFNTADGVGALLNNKSGSNNIALGTLAGYYITTGSSNIDIGNLGLSTDTNIIRIGSTQTQTFIAGVINGDGSGLTNVPGTAPWQTAGGSNVTAAPNQAYLLTNSSSTLVTLPTTANVGDIVTVSGDGSDGWEVEAAPGQSIGELSLTNWFDNNNSPSADWSSVASSADGTRLVAVVNGGQIYNSSDSGGTWSTNNNSLPLTWTSVASSADGTELVAAAAGGIYTSTDSGVTWSQDTNTPQVIWRCVASSADGTELVAGSVTNVGKGAAKGNLYTSSDSGGTWISSTNAGVNEWTAVTSSSDGTKVAAAATASPIYTSTDSGVTWSTNNNSLSANWTSVASSADGTKLVAASNMMLGKGVHKALYTSSDSGVTWIPSANDVEVWSSVASSADGNKLVAAASRGPIFTSYADFSGGAGTTAQFQYLGNGVWQPLVDLPSNVLTNGENGVTLSGSVSGDGSGLTNVALLAGGNTFSGNQTVVGNVGIGTTTPNYPLDFGQSLGDRLVLYDDGNGTSYGFGIQGAQLQIHADNTSSDIVFGTGSSTNLSEAMRIKGNGNVGIGTSSPAYPLQMGSGAYCSVAGAWTSVSDRNAKEDFTAIQPADVLARVAALPITEWKYKAEPDGTEHLGPVAQDFHAAFGLNGADDTHISTVDEGGVALAAIQGLNRKLEAENAELKARLDKLERLLQQKTEDDTK